jgi:hypothetical protein
MTEWLHKMDRCRESRIRFSTYFLLCNPNLTLNSLLADKKLQKGRSKKLLKQLIGTHYKCPPPLYWVLLAAAGSGIQFHTLTWPVPSPVKNMLPGPV